MTARRAAALLAGALLLLLAACNGAPPGDPTPTAVMPTGLIAEAGDRYVDLTWEDAGADGLEAYGIYQGTSATELERVTEVPAGTTMYRVSGLTNGTEYFFALDSKTTAGARSTRTQAVSATPRPAGDVPLVTRTMPSDGAIDIGRNSNINVHFSREMNEDATERAFSVSPPVDCTFSWNASSDRLSCVPADDMDADEEYMVTIGASAMAENGLTLDGPVTFTFITGSDVFPACVLGEAVLGACVLGG